MTPHTHPPEGGPPSTELDPAAAVAPLSRDPAAQAGVRQLFQEVFGHTVSAEHWAWKYGGPPGAMALNRVLLGPEGPERPWGHVGALVLPGQWQGAPAWVAHLTDVMVHPRHRSGLEPASPYGRLMRAIAGDLQRISAQHPAAGTAPTPLLAFGFPGLTPSRLGARMGLYRPLYRVCAFHHRPPDAVGSGLHLQHWPLGPEGLDTLGWVQSLGRHWGPTQPQPGPLKGAAYIAWRYGQHPLKPYRLWRVRGPWQQTLGWLVTRQSPQAVVVDAWLPPVWSTGQGWAHVLGALVRATGQEVWASWRPSAAPWDTAEPTLIEAGEFRARELTGHTPGPWAEHPVPGVDGRAGPPLFQPGDTDVF